MYSIVVYIPKSHLEQVKHAMFNADAGRIGNYQQCCWQVEGQGQFKPMQGNKAFIGETDKLSTLEEFRVEMVCSKENIQAVVEAIKTSHPYETPAYHYFEVCN